MKERALVSTIISWLKASHPGIFFWKTHDTFHAGIPDIVGCWNGVFFGIEVKIKGGRVERIQSFVIQNIKDAGGVAGVAWCLDDAKKIMDEVKKKGTSI